MQILNFDWSETDKLKVLTTQQQQRFFFDQLLHWSSVFNFPLTAKDLKMLLESGDLIPVLSHAVEIPWTKRKNQIMAFLYRGRVTFQTMVYDSNVGDISPLSTYFNPRKWTVEDLNQRFGQVYEDENYLPSGFTPLSTTLTVSSDS